MFQLLVKMELRIVLVECVPVMMVTLDQTAVNVPLATTLIQVTMSAKVEYEQEC